ncbi:glycosyltransferase family 4 protein [Adlercreutzia caecimuris]|uniref:glycosyltransferase family 4 protein n=1 Tax=Adlercreutzia caecimuris TaxID=671266 RepID=UPI00272C557F|nr:glycosyltransferase family 4 protein [Adlercreutzia caecimuris]
MSGKTIWTIMIDNCLPEHGPHNRHFWFAKHLKEQGYNPVVFVASRERGNAIQMIEDDAPFKVDDSYGFPFVYIRIKDYGESMKKRILSIFEFHKRLNKYADTFVEMYGKPDVILGSNGYPLSPWLANRFAKKYQAASICEICDLWPLSLEEYDIIKPGGAIAKAMYVLERKNYENANAIIFSMEGGGDYIRDKGWDIDSGGKIDLAKVHHINNGIDLDAFRENTDAFTCPVSELTDNGKVKIVYAGSVRKANNIGYLVDVAECMRGDERVEFVALGAGDELEELREKVQERGLSNISFPGAIDKREIPASLEKARLLLLLYSSMQVNLSQYGMSQNKLFDYLASGKPVLSNLPSSYSIINKYDCGIERSFSDPEEFAEQIRRMISDDEAMERWGENARATADLYSFVSHTNHLIEIIEDITKEEQ